MGVVEFIECLIMQWEPSSPGRLWNDRVKRLEAAPLLACPIDDPARWRADHGLDPAVAFRIAKSENVDVDRAQLYKRYLPSVILYAKARLGSPPPWADDVLEQFGQELLENRCPNWPVASEPSSVFFTRQLLGDVVAALMSMQRVGSPRPFALLEALNESRRIGNRFDAAHADAAVAAFKRELDRAMGW